MAITVNSQLCLTTQSSGLSWEHCFNVLHLAARQSLILVVMSHEDHMKSLMNFLLLICLFSFTQSTHATDSPNPESVQKAVALAKLLYPALNDISSDWSLKAVKRNVASEGFDGNEELYKRMLSKVSHLGRFKKCTDIEIGNPTDLDIPEAVALVGPCQFENGTAKIAFIFLELDGKTKIVSAIVFPPIIEPGSGT